ncbi:MAG: nucleotide exchange factor GrpE [Gemmatimonadetes bacterium]|nr:nucleotide exchange factor GrpE [Gemmatimonadota bacterium]
MSKKTPPSDDTPSMPEADVPELEQQTLPDEWTAEEAVPAIEAAKALAEAEDRFLRLAAEYENYRRRTAKEKAEAFDRGASAMVQRLMDELDDIDRLVSSDPETTTYEAYRAAFVLIQKKFEKELGAAGLEKIDPTGLPFDPNEHDAVAMTTLVDGAEPQTVAATFQTGYRFKGSVIRPARVQVYGDQGS